MRVTAGVMKWCTQIVVLALGAVSGASAQAVPEPARELGAVAPGAQPDAARSRRARFIDPEDGQFDLSRSLESPRGFLPIPIIVTEPAVGYGGGAVGMFLRPRDEAGQEGWSRPNISAVGALATQNGTKAAFAGDFSRWMDGRLRTVVGIGTGQVNLDFYDVGTDPATAGQKVSYSLQFTGVVAQANWQLAPRSPWALGLRYVYADVEPKLREEAPFPGLTDRVHAKISAPSVILEFDSRDSVFTPTRGVYAESSWMASREALGATVDFERFQQVLMGWQPIGHRVTLGARGDYAWSSDGTPFFLRPFVQLRGVPAMRYQGDQMASIEAEMGWQFSGRWSVVGFGGAGATRTTGDAYARTRNVGSGGIGFRYELARKFGLHVGVDLAHSPGTTAVYLQVGSAWARP